MSEAALLHDVRLALGSDPSLVCWRQNSGALTDVNGRLVRYGLAVGSADLVGILAPSGRFFALEVKTPQGRVTPEQVQWAELVRRMGGFCAVVRSVDQAMTALERARRGETE